MLKTILMVIYVIVCIVLAIVVLSQEGKDASLTSSISGEAADLTIPTGARIREAQSRRYLRR